MTPAILVSLVGRLAAALLLLALARHDLRCRRLPNRLVAGFALLYLPVSIALSAPLLPHLWVGLLALLIGMLLTAAGTIGAGDAKLAAAILWWAGPAQWWMVLVIASQAGLLVGLLGLGAKALRRRPHPAWARSALRWLSVERGVPYGVALAAGGLAQLAIAV